MAGTSRGSTRSRASKSSAENAPILSPLNPKLRKDKTRNNSLIRIFNVNLKFLLGFGIISFVIALFFIYPIVNPMEKPQKPRVITPLPAPKLTDLPMFQGEHRESLYWGTYRPQVYFGVRARTPQSLVAGLMWIGVKDGRYFMRHVCQDSDELKQYGWTSHNGRDYGHQVLTEQTMSLTTSFLKSKGHGSGYGGDWAVRIGAQSNESIPDDEMLNTAHLFFYMADEGGKSFNLGRGVLDIHDDSVLASGSRSDTGDWQLHLLSEARKFGHLLLSDSSDDSPSILVFQISARIPFRADIVFLSGTSTRDSRVEERLSRLTGISLTSLLSEKQKEFDDKFKKCFSLSDELGLESESVGKVALGNMLGGIGYFFGQSKIWLPSTSTLNAGDNSVLYWPAELYTAVPSRPFFPRGFLWDEGFHQLLIWRWDIYISLDIIGHWLDLMNIDGWIPRELILGAEALSKVPEEFVLQHPTNGNPPTLFLALRDVISSLKKEKFAAAEASDISVFLDRAFVRLEAWFKWFNTTQSGKELGSYYWHGRDAATIRELNPKTLSSGLDDYPRASHPNEDERHVDLRCWMHLAANSMRSIAELLKMDKDVEKEYGFTAKMLSDFELLNKMHLDSANGAYCDYGNHTEKVQLTWKILETGSNYPRRELVREVLEKPVLQLVPHLGYVSLFPFILRLIPPDSWILDRQLDLISNRSILWTDYGLRSLSKTSSMYMKRNTEHDAPYWRGPIWIPLNYLIVSSLHHYSQEPGPHRERAKTIYTDLRSNLIRNIVGNYQRTGYLWEQYDQKRGKGKGARLFTGWTATVLLIMAEAYHEV
nr:PREDICTED: mannosyl-oligosaccharide glucosidase GCS1-like isoform X2 [Nicotiana sylvestris]